MDARFPVFKGLQKPLEFLGIRGRFLLIAGLTIGGCFLGFFVSSLLFGQLAGFITFLVSLGTGLVSIYIKQKQGLHSKKRHKGIYVYHYLFKR